MPERVFIDTNVLVYAEDADAGSKRERARQLIRSLVGEERAVLSTQVLQEYFAVITRKLGVPVDLARDRVETYARVDVVVIRPEHILAAIDTMRLRNLSFWDALVLRAAHAAGCARILTEDLQHGSTVDGVVIENPFR
jgi:predicted nucleic acid-binding protein